MLPLKKTAPVIPKLVISHRKKVAWENEEFIDELIDLKKARYRDFRARKLLYTSMGFMISLLLTVGMFEWRVYERTGEVNFNQGASLMDDILDIPVTQQPPPPPKRVLVQPNVIAVPEEELVEEIEIDLDMDIAEETAIEEMIAEPVMEEMVEEKADEVFLIVEKAPEPAGGLQAFYQFVAENIEYPSAAKRMGVSGKVFVQFVVNQDGSITDVMVVKGIGGGCDEEAVRVLKLAPAWTPGKQRGKSVRVRMVIPIVFMLRD